MREITALALAVGIDPIYSRLKPSIYLISTVHQCRRHFVRRSSKLGADIQTWMITTRKKPASSGITFTSAIKTRSLLLFFSFFEKRNCKVYSFEFWCMFKNAFFEVLFWDNCAISLETSWTDICGQFTEKTLFLLCVCV